MPHRRPGPTDDDRRQDLRREEDVETHEIVDHAGEDAPLIHGLLKTWKVAIAVAGLSATLGASMAAVGFRIAGPKDDVARANARLDTVSRRFERLEERDRAMRDSVFGLLSVIQSDLRDLKSRDVRELQLTQCQMMRRLAPDLRPSDSCSK